MTQEEKKVWEEQWLEKAYANSGRKLDKTKYEVKEIDGKIFYRPEEETNKVYKDVEYIKKEIDGKIFYRPKNIDKLDYDKENSVERFSYGNISIWPKIDFNKPIHKLDASKVIDMSYMFEGLEKEKKFPLLDTTPQTLEELEQQKIRDEKQKQDLEEKFKIIDLKFQAVRDYIKENHPNIPDALCEETNMINELYRNEKLDTKVSKLDNEQIELEKRLKEIAEQRAKLIIEQKEFPYKDLVDKLESIGR